MTGLDQREFQALLAQARLASIPGVDIVPQAQPPAAATDMAPHPAYHGGGSVAVPARCRACDTPLSAALVDRAEDQTGLHANCDEPEVPPSTLAEVRDVLTRYDAGRPRSVQTTLGPSELGTPCPRQIALKLAGVARHPRGLPWAPMCGTAVHDLMEKALTAENERLGRQRWVLEQEVQLDDELSGHGDAYDTDHALVVDWKYTGTTARRKAVRRSVPNSELVSMEYRTQAHLYGLGHRNAGRRVRFVRLVLLARSHDFTESVEWTEQYREDIALNAMTRFYAIRDQVLELDGGRHPEQLIHVEAAPGEACKWCPFQRVTPPGGPPVDATGCAGNTEAHTDVEMFFK